MNNTINSYNNNLAFNARYIQFNNSGKMPRKVYEAVLKNDAVEKFLYADKPKTLWGKFIDLFKREEILFVDYTTDVFTKTKEARKDPYAKRDRLIFSFGKNNSKMADRRSFELIGFQQGIERKQGSVRKPNEDYKYKPPIVTSEDKIAKQVDGLTDIDSKLKYYRL